MGHHTQDLSDVVYGNRSDNNPALLHVRYCHYQGVKIHAYVEQDRMSSDQPYEYQFTIEPVITESDLVAVQQLFVAYVDWLDLDISFQGFEMELRVLPGRYAPPSGRLLIARKMRTGEPLGCIAVRPLEVLDEPGCEMKRLYVSPAARGMGVGKALAARAILEAKMVPYRYMKLDTLPGRMAGAIQLYKELGFVPCERYYETPLEDTLFMHLDLCDGEST